MFSFAAIISLVEALPAAIDGTDKIIADLKTLLTTNEAQQIEALLSQLFTVTSTPGSAAVVEPVTNAGMKK